ncbi:MMPL family protein [Anatilimnocola aggregata]|uniref:MMPL family protein n=1 Tax=Anatilimnocola aggregata TaxID=2528021 RepID=A0A517YDP5_9BACT|nr:MMPL family transporter [Anatilimnocola aggregata]QDU28262.1 MMPL family protein [Anatilimnocola aggregata]
MTEKTTFFGRRAIIVLMIVFFLVPFALRGARMSVLGMKNDVRDWLPKGFSETAELAWFRQHFLSEQFVVVSWDGCTGNEADQRYKLFLAKLKPEEAPSKLAAEQAAVAKREQAALAKLNSEGQEAANDGAGSSETISDATEQVADEASPTRYIHQADFIGDRLGLYLPKYVDGSFDVAENWGMRGEKWLRGRANPDSDSVEEAWYYITPDGDLYRWDGVDAPLASAYRELQRKIAPQPVRGQLVHSFGKVDGPWYFAEPRRLRAQLFKTVTTGPDVLASLVRPGGELASNPEEAKERLTGMLFGPNGEQTCMVLTLSDAAKHNLHLVLGRGGLGKPRGRLYEIAQESNISEQQLRLGGPPVDNVAIDEEGSITLVRLIGMTAILGLGLSLACFRTISATIMVFLVGGISAVVTLAMMWWFGDTVDAIAMSMPALVYVLGLSGAAHTINYYYDAVEEKGLIGAPERAIMKSWKPALLCNITTAIGLFSLITSELAPIRKFGFYAGLGVLATLIITHTYLPAALQIWPQIRKKKAAGADDRPWLDTFLGDFWQKLGGFIVRNHAVVAIVCIIVIAATGYGVMYTNTSVNMLRMFHSKAKIIQDYEWLEANLGELVPMEIVVRVPKASLLPPAAELTAENLRVDELTQQFESATDPAEKQKFATELGKLEVVQLQRQKQMPFLERMELAARVQRVVQQEFGATGNGKIGRAMSAATFVRNLPEPKGDSRSMLTRGATSKRLEAHREEFLHSDYLRLDEQDQSELWRVSIRVGATKGVDYGTLIHELKDAVEPILSAQQRRDHIMQELIAKRGNKSPANSKVLLLGVPAPAPQEVAAAPAANQNGTTKRQVNQTAIFSEALTDMLTIKRLKVITFIPGVDEAPANWKEYLGNFDCVVLISDQAAYSGFDLSRATKLLVDARDHKFDGNELNSAARRSKSDVGLTHATYTGVVPIVYKAQRTLLNSLIESTFWSFITITPLMMFISRSFWGGLVAMLPNVLPVLMVFGGMGWLGIDVDVGSMMTASIALGVAVDDTIHYLNWYREELDRLKDRKLAILAAYKHCATPTFQAAIISGLGLSVFALSTFTPTQRFGYLMLVILWMGVVAELIFFPALLAGPLGVVFKPRKRKDEDLAITPELQLPLAAVPVPAASEAESVSSVPQPAGKAALLNHLRQDNSHSRRH